MCPPCCLPTAPQICFRSNIFALEQQSCFSYSAVGRSSQCGAAEAVAAENSVRDGRCRAAARIDGFGLTFQAVNQVRNTAAVLLEISGEIGTQSQRERDAFGRHVGKNEVPIGAFAYAQ